MKKCIIVISFGTSYAETREKTIEACERKIAQAFPDYEIRSVFTSNRIRKKLNLESLEETLEHLKNDGFAEVLLQPLHLIPGQEYHEKILKLALRYQKVFPKLMIGRPVLTEFKDFEKVIEALKFQIPSLEEGQGVLFMGHGSYHPANACYSCLQLLMLDRLKNIFLANVSYYPELKDILPKLKKNNIKEIWLMPFMLVAGDHACNDMVGEEETSWKNILQREGFIVREYLHGLGENPKFQEIYLDLIKDVLDKNSGRQFS